MSCGQQCRLYSKKHSYGAMTLEFGSLFFFLFFFYGSGYERILGHSAGRSGWNFYNVMNSWARQRAPLDRCVHFIFPSVQRAGTCSLLGDHRWSEQVPEAHAAGIFSLFSTSGMALSAFQLSRDRGIAGWNSLSSSQLRVNAGDTLGRHHAHICSPMRVVCEKFPAGL